MKKIILMITSVIIVALIGIKAILDRKKEEEKEILQPKKLLYGYPLFFKKKRRKKSSKYRNYSTRVRTKTKKKNDINEIIVTVLKDMEEKEKKNRTKSFSYINLFKGEF